jgi:dTDP-4-amino-4,6-dideoxygalactose transaminase
LIQAAFRRVTLKQLDDWNGRRRKIAQQYLEAAGAPGKSALFLSKETK